VKVICKYNKHLRDDDIYPILLTKNKLYDIISEDLVYDNEVYYSILCDDGVPRDAIGKRFIKLEKWRDDRLKIGERKR
jgi:hypothetical protein